MTDDDRTRDPKSVRFIEDAGYELYVCMPGLVLRHRLPANGRVVLGRADNADVVLRDDSVSRGHAAVICGEPPMLEDLGSRNGTRVGSKTLAKGERAPLALGAVFHVGSVVVVVQRAVGTETQTSSQTTVTEQAADADVVARDPTVRRLFDLVDVLAPSNLTVLILGETGVGKEVYARTVHARSPRAAHVYLQLNCAALAESLLESELFGYERGAFTGAIQPKPGLFESADGGTVFLDEIGEMTLGTQAKLLRFLESGEVMRLGSLRPKRVDVRIVSATNRDLERRIAEGHFRADLYYRINGMTVTLPPLRERPDDIVPLAELFLAKAASAGRRPTLTLSPEAAFALRAHAWPGNIRELRNVMDRAAVFTKDTTVRADALGLAVLAPPKAEASPSGPLRNDVGAFERERIVNALAQCNGNQKEAAKLLGIGLRTLVTKLGLHGIDRPRKR